MAENNNPKSAVLSAGFTDTIKQAFQPLADEAKAAKNKSAASPAVAPATTPPVVAPVTPAATPVVPPLNPVIPATAAVPTADDEADAAIESGKVSPKSADFKRVKENAKRFKSENEVLSAAKTKLEAELAEARKAPVVDAGEVDKLKQELAKKNDEINTYALEFVPEFNEKYEKRFNAVKDAVKALAPDKADQLIQVMSLPNSPTKAAKLAEMLEESDELTRQDIYNANRELHKIAADRQGEIANSKGKVNEIVQSRQAAAKAQQESLGKAFDDTATELMKGNPLFQPREGDEAWNSSVRERIAAAKAIYNGNPDPVARAKDAANAATVPLLLGALQQAQTRNKELEEQVKGITASNPGFINTGHGKSGAGNDNKTFAEKFIAAQKG